MGRVLNPEALRLLWEELMRVDEIITLQFGIILPRQKPWKRMGKQQIPKEVFRLHDILINPGIYIQPQPQEIVYNSTWRSIFLMI